MRTIYIETGWDDMTNTLLALDSFLQQFGDESFKEREREMKKSENQFLQQAASWRVEFNHDVVLALIAGDIYSELLDEYVATLLSFQPENVRNTMRRVFLRMYSYNHELGRDIFRWPHLMAALRMDPSLERQFNSMQFWDLVKKTTGARVFVLPDVLETGYSGGESLEPADVSARDVVDIDVDVE